MAETYKSVTELMKTARGNKAIGQCLCDIVDFQEILDDTPNADVVPVVRCKDCKHYKDASLEGFKKCAYSSTQKHDFMVLPDDFCNYGERK